MSKPYDDDHYMRWVIQLHDMVDDYLETEGNDQDSLYKEVAEAVRNLEPDA